MIIFLVNEEAFWGFHFHFRVHFSGWRGGGYGWRRPIRAFHFPHGGPLLHPDPRQVTFVINNLFLQLIFKQCSWSLQPPVMCAPTRREVRLELWPRGQSSPAALVTGTYCPLSGITRIIRFHSGKKCFCLREPVFWGSTFLIFRLNVPNFEAQLS